jgi:hypothetical protein
VERKLAWTAGNISFYGETLTEGVQEFNRYNRRHIAIADPAIAQMKVGGSFEANEPGELRGNTRKHFVVSPMHGAKKLKGKAMGFEALVHAIERITSNRRPRAIADTFFRCGMSIVVFGFLKGHPVVGVALAVVVATIVSLVAIGLRYLESRCPEPTPQRPPIPTR